MLVQKHLLIRLGRYLSHHLKECNHTLALTEEFCKRHSSASMEHIRQVAPCDCAALEAYRALILECRTKEVVDNGTVN